VSVETDGVADAKLTTCDAYSAARDVKPRRIGGIPTGERSGARIPGDGGRRADPALLKVSRMPIVLVVALGCSTAFS